MAAFFTPQASLAFDSGSPDLVHSFLTHSLTGVGPAGPGSVSFRW